LKRFRFFWIIKLRAVRKESGISRSQSLEEESVAAIGFKTERVKKK